MSDLKKIYRTVIQYEILSEEPIELGMPLSEYEVACMVGECSGRMLESTVANEVLEGKKAVKQIESNGTSLEFFQMNKNGRELKDGW